MKVVLGVAVGVVLVVAFAIAHHRRVVASGPEGVKEQHLHARASTTAPANTTDFYGWSYEFVLSFDSNGTSSIATGAEYYSVKDSVVRRDWVQGDFVYEDCPLGSESSGSQIFSTSSGRQHVLQSRLGVWSCVEGLVSPFEPGVSGSWLSSLIASSSSSSSPNDTPCTLYSGSGPRPGPPCRNNSSFQVCLTSQLQPVFITTPCFKMQMWNWRGPPAAVPGADVGPLSVPSVCPVDNPPSPMGYTLALVFLLTLFFAMFTIRRKKDGSAF